MANPLRAALVTVGDELLLGRTVDTNGAWLGRWLGGQGIPVIRRYTVADREPEIRDAVAASARDAELVLVTGGLGPTPDDLTRDAVAALAGTPLLVDPEILRDIRERFRRRGLDELPEPNRRVAQVPEGAIKLANPHGTAPGLALELGASLVVLLPGVPREMKGIVTEGLAPLLARRFGDRMRPVHVRTLSTTGIPESLLSQRLAPLLEGIDPVGVAFLPDVRGVDLRLTVFDVSQAEAEAAFDDVERRVGSVLAPWRFQGSDGELAQAVVAALDAQGATLAVAESCTGGLVAKRLTDVPGASRVLLGGVVAYANPVKEEILGVDPQVLLEQGAVSQAVAVGMAQGVARALGAQAGVGVTGVAGPGGGSPDKPVGTVWLAASFQGRTVARRESFPGDREEVRERAAQAALFLLLRLVEGRPEAPGEARG